MISRFSSTIFLSTSSSHALTSHYSRQEWTFMHAYMTCSGQTTHSVNSVMCSEVLPEFYFMWHNSGNALVWASFSGLIVEIWEVKIADISYLKNTARAFKHFDPFKGSPAAICSQLAALYASWLAACFWSFCSQSASRCCIYVASTPRYLKLVTV